MSLEKRVYTSTNQFSFLGVLKAALLGYKNSFYLAKQLAKRDIKSQYRQSVFGVLWAILPIVVNSLVWIFLQGTGTIMLTETKIPYPLFVILGTILWSILSECINLPINTVNANKNIITKINFDKEALISLGLIKFFYNFLIKLGIVVFFMIFFKVIPTYQVFYFIPFFIVSVIFFVNVGILLTPIGLLYNDISRMIPIFLQFLMYVTPVVYAKPPSGFMNTLMTYNPLAYWMSDLKNCLTGNGIENPTFWIIFSITTLLLSVLTLVVYRISIPIITERMSA
jgi:lipopolysaccharide transport system permease protein